MRQGRFISFEGGEGAGKSTQVRRLAERLRAKGREVVVTREPGGSPGAEALRTLLVSGSVDRWSPTTETLILYAARRDHVERVILPALEAGAFVLCDRFFDSTRAYQGAAGGVSKSFIGLLEEAVLEGLVPDLTLVLDLDPADGLRRAERRGEGATRFEEKGGGFHERLRAEFLEIAAREPERCVVLDAGRPVEVLEDAVWSVVEDRLLAR